MTANAVYSESLGI